MKLDLHTFLIESPNIIDPMAAMDPSDPYYCEPISKDRLLESFMQFGPKMAVTHGHVEVSVECKAEDMEWNSLDQLHRHYVHGLYGPTLRLVKGRRYALSMTEIKALNFLPLLMVVTDLQLRPGLYIQAFSFFNLIYVHIVIETVQQGDQSVDVTDWYIVSRRMFKFLHGFINRRYHKLVTTQADEDLPIRLRRTAIRRKGYKFLYEEPDFITANKLTSNVIFPKLDQDHRISLADIKEGLPQRVAAGEIEFLVRRDGPGEFTIWTEACPHEGASLADIKPCGARIECAWHGLKFTGSKLSAETPQATHEGYELSLEGEELVIR